MVRHLGLRHAQAVDELADAQLSRLERVPDGDDLGIGEDDARRRGPVSQAAWSSRGSTMGKSMSGLVERPM